MYLMSWRQVTANLPPQPHTPTGSGFSNKSKLPWEEPPALPAAPLFFPICSWCVVYSEDEEIRQGWINKAGGLESTQSMVHRWVTTSRTSSGAKEAEESQSDNPFSSSIALSALLLSLQTTAPSLEPPPKEQAFPMFTPVRAQQAAWTVCFTQCGTTSLHFCQTWGPQCTVVALKST